MSLTSLRLASTLNTIITFLAPYWAERKVIQYSNKLFFVQIMMYECVYAIQNHTTFEEFDEIMAI